MQTSRPGTVFLLRWVSLLKGRCGLSTPLDEDNLTGRHGVVEGGQGSDCPPVAIDVQPGSFGDCVAVLSCCATCWCRIERGHPIYSRFHMNIAPAPPYNQH